MFNSPRSLQSEDNNQDETEYISRSILVMMALVVLNTTLLSYRKKLSLRYPTLTKYLQDCIVTTFIGVLAGAFLLLIMQGEILLTIGHGYENLFMIILLPPIIFESTLNMHKPSFFANIGSILTFAIFGTLIAMALTSAGMVVATALGFSTFSVDESFAFGSLISSTDPVSVMSVFKEINADKNLWSIIFGESILNDAIAIITYQVVTEISTDTYGNSMNPVLGFIIIFFGSILVGFLIGTICAFILKKYFGVDTGNNLAEGSTETTIMMIVPWVSYLIGESFGLSGIVTILFCGISINKYALPNMSDLSRKITQNLYSTLSSTFENLSFMFIGIGFFSFPHNWSKLGGFIFVYTFIIITASRFTQVYLLSWIINKFRDRRQLSSDFKAIIAHSGFRGAMAFALATSATNVYASDGSGQDMLTLTLVHACFTICVLSPLFVFLAERYDVKENPENKDNYGSSIDDSGHCWNKIRHLFGKLDELLMKFLVRNPREEVLLARAGLDEADLERSLEKRAAFLQSKIPEQELVKMEAQSARDLGV